MAGPPISTTPLSCLLPNARKAGKPMVCHWSFWRPMPAPYPSLAERPEARRRSSRWRKRVAGGWRRSVCHCGGPAAPFGATGRWRPPWGRGAWRWRRIGVGLRGPKLFYNSAADEDCAGLPFFADGFGALPADRSYGPSGRGIRLASSGRRDVLIFCNAMARKIRSVRPAAGNSCFASHCRIISSA